MADELNIPDGARSDEALILAFYDGEKGVLDILFDRYIKYLRFFLLKESWRKDDSSIDDIIQEIFLVVLQTLHDKKFKPEGEGEATAESRPNRGSFRAWFYLVARNVCRTYNRNQSHQPLNISQSFIETAPDDPVVPEIIKKEEEQEQKKKLKKILSRLSPDEQDLMEQLSKGKTYKQIHEMSEFHKFSIDYLMLKVYNIRKKILGGK